MRLLDKRLLVVTGKGGVGKSSVAAALALHAARSGKRTLVCEINSDRLGRLYGKPVGPEVREVEDGLWAVDVRPEEALREYALMVLKFKSVYKAVFENRLVRYFLRFIPSVSELVMLGKVLFHVKETLPGGAPRYDLVVLDAPATGHAISFLSVPQVLLDTVAVGPLWTEAKWMRDLLVDPKTTAAVLVSLPEEMPVNETLELEDALRRKVKVPVALVVLNGYTPPRFDERDLQALGGSHLHEVAKSHFDRAQLALDSRSRLERAVAAPVATVPRLYEQAQGPELVEQVTSALARALESAP